MAPIYINYDADIQEDALASLVEIPDVSRYAPPAPIQANAEAVLTDTVRHWHARAASAIVLDPRTGAVLAMAVAPGFDANRFGAVIR